MLACPETLIRPSQGGTRLGIAPIVTDRINGGTRKVAAGVTNSHVPSNQRFVMGCQ